MILFILTQLEFKKFFFVFFHLPLKLGFHEDNIREENFCKLCCRKILECIYCSHLEILRKKDLLKLWFRKIGDPLRPCSAGKKISLLGFRKAERDLFL